MHINTVPLGNDREFAFGIHESIMESVVNQPNIANELLAPLMTASDKLSMSTWLKQATRVTYLKARHFEYYPVLKIETSQHVRYFAHGYECGWWQIEEDEVWFAGTRPPMEGEHGTVSTSNGLQVAIHRNVIEIIEETLA
jgi:hypothetical protein